MNAASCLSTDGLFRHLVLLLVAPLVYRILAPFLTKSDLGLLAMSRPSDRLHGMVSFGTRASSVWAFMARAALINRDHRSRFWDALMGSAPGRGRGVCRYFSTVCATLLRINAEFSQIF